MSEQEQGKDLALVDQEGALAIRIAPELDPTKTAGAVWSSLQPKTDRERIAVMEAFQGSIPKLSSVIGRTLLVQNLGRQQVFIADTASGEYFPAIRTVFFTASGELYSSVSRGIDQSIGQLINQFGWPPWTKPLPLIPRELPRPGAKRWLYFEVDKSHFNKEGNLK